MNEKHSKHLNKRDESIRDLDEQYKHLLEAHKRQAASDLAQTHSSHQKTLKDLHDSSEKQQVAWNNDK